MIGCTQCMHEACMAERHCARDGSQKGKLLDAICHATGATFHAICHAVIQCTVEAQLPGACVMRLCHAICHATLSCDLSRDLSCDFVMRSVMRTPMRLCHAIVHTSIHANLPCKPGWGISRNPFAICPRRSSALGKFAQAWARLPMSTNRWKRHAVRKRRKRHRYHK